VKIITHRRSESEDYRARIIAASWSRYTAHQKVAASGEAKSTPPPGPKADDY